MEVGVVTDVSRMAQTCVHAGANIVVLCHNLKSAGGGTTPTLGAVRNCCTRVCPLPGRAGTPPKVFALLRPSVGRFVYDDPDVQQAMLDDLASFSEASRLTGVMVGCQTNDGQVDVALARQMALRSGHLELWYHRGYMLLESPEAFEQIADAGFHGAVISLHGDTVNGKLEYATNMLKSCAAVGLKALVCGCIPACDQFHVVSELKHFVADGTLKGWIVPVPVEDDFHGALMPWRQWDVTTNLWQESHNPLSELEALDRVHSMYTALTAVRDSPTATTTGAASTLGTATMSTA